MANSTRNVFFEEIHKIMLADENVLIVSVDLAGPPFDSIRNEFPDRYIGIGIAEQNSIAVACGLASIGKKVIVYAANPFPLLRSFDQIRNCACMMKMPIAIVGLGTGFSVAECGSTHFAIEDIALASICAGLDIISVSDCDIAKAVANLLFRNDKPIYIRFGKWADEPLGVCGELDFSKGYRVIKKGGDVAILATGCTVKLIYDMDLQNVTLIDWFNVSNKKYLIDELKKFKRVVTVEEQLLRGGIGSIVLEEFNERDIKTPVSRIGLVFKDGYPQEYGDRTYWLETFNITKKHILEAIKR